MPSDSHFRIATCLTLVLACAGLGYSEWDLVPGVAAFTVLVVGMIVAAFALQRRISLGPRLANLLGLGIAVAAAAWLLAQVESHPEGISALLIQPGLLLPFVGPFLMVLIPAKLFRPKHLGDWWTMQGIALAGMALGASMSESAAFAAILFAYICSALWSVSILYLRTAAGMVPPIPPSAPAAGPPGPLPVRGPEIPFRVRPLLRPLATAAAAVVLFSLPLFLLTPRSTAERWAFGKQRMETGFALENSLDINKAGDLGVNRDVALRVSANEADGRPKLDLDPGTLWRGISYSDYEDGKWVRRSYPSSIGSYVRTARLPAGALPPDLGPGMYRLDFEPDDASAASVVASPARWKAGESSPVRTVGRTDIIPWQPLYDGSFVPDGFNRRARTYRQWTAAADEPGLGEAFELSPVSQFPKAKGVLTAARVAGIRDWSIDRLRKFVRDGKLPASAITEADTRSGLELTPRHYEAAARAYCEYFNTSPEFTYTMKLRRQDRRLDAIEDFLTNTRSGHCQWYASALCLALRSVGVPAQIAMGFKGQESLEDGTYNVRQENAHAWAEVMIPRPAPAGFPYQDEESAREGMVWHWLSLDPTPMAGQSAESSGWFDTSSWQGALSSLTDFLLKYDAERRKEVIDAAPGRFAQFAGVVAASVFGILLVRRVRKARPRRQRASAAFPEEPLPPAWYVSLRRVLGRRGIELAVGQTPKEFAEAARTELRAEFADVADVPAFVTSKLYRVRFAGQPLGAGEIAEVETAIRELDRRLNRRGGVRC